MTPEALFLRYAFPCVYIKKQRGLVDDEMIERLEKAAIDGAKVERGLLERIFFNASQQLEVLAEELGKEKWSMDVVKDYFLSRHNGIVDSNKDLPYGILKELCKIRKGVVMEELRGEFVKVSYPGCKRIVSKKIFPSVRVGGRVRVHYAFIVEVL